MYASGLGNAHTINAFVRDKVSRFKSSDKTFASIFSFITSEPDNIFCESNDGYHIFSTSYKQFEQRTYRFASLINAQAGSTPKNSVIGLFLDNSEQWLEIFWAVLMCGYRPLLLNKRLPDSILASVISDTNPCFIISDGKVLTDSTILLDGLNKDLPSVEMFAPSAANWANEIILISSGTSSHVKLSYYTGENIFWQICDSAHIIRTSRLMKKHYKGRLKLLTFLPFYHIFGLVAVFMWFAFFSRSFVLLNDYSATTILNTIKRHQVTHIFAVPLLWDTVYREAMKKISSRGQDTVLKLQKAFKISDKLDKLPLLYSLFSKLAFRQVRDGLFGNSICFMISGGAAIPSETLRFFNHIGYHLANGYGMTEVGITSVELSNRPDILISGSVGLPFYSLEYRIDSNSELLVRGKTLAHAIYSEGTLVPRVDENWFPTHDRAEYRNGRYYILGRTDDMLIGPNGENVDPDRVEGELNIYLTPPRCLIHIGEGKRSGVLLITVPRLASQETVDAIRSSASQELNRLGLLGTVGQVFLTYDALMGANDFKANRTKLSVLFSEGKLSDANKPISAEEITSEITHRVQEVFAEILGRKIEEISLNAHFFFDLGGSSLDYLSAIMMLQNEFHVGFPTNEGNGLSTVKEISAFIERSVRDL